jgi:hypothetical protein
MLFSLQASPSSALDGALQQTIITPAFYLA